MERILDKYLLRQILVQAGLSHIKSIPGAIVDTLVDWPFGGAAYFKPVHGSFSMHVVRCNNLDDVRRAKNAWLSGNSPAPKFIADYLLSQAEYHLEEAFDGELMSVEAMSCRGKFQYIGLTSRILFSENPIVEMGSCFPYHHPLEATIIETVERAHSVLGFTDGPSHTELIVNTVGQLEIIDFNPRFIGADVLQASTTHMA